MTGDLAAETTYQQWVPPKRGFYVYRAWGSDDSSIYVGMVGTKGPAYLPDRLRHHEITAEWWPLVAHIDWAEFGNVKEARAEETRQIALQVPIYNKKRPLVRIPGAVVTPVRSVPASPAPVSIARKLPRLPRPPKDAVSDAGFAEWPYWVEGEAGWMRYASDATGPPPGIRWLSRPGGDRI